MADTKLVFPFYLYPNFFGSGYKDFKTYREEVLRLYHFIETYKAGFGDLLKFNIGAPFEEECSQHYFEEAHYMQLFSSQLKHFIRSRDSSNKVTIVIISPNKSFSDKHYKTPKFIEYTDEEFNWEKSNKFYKSHGHNVDINIFCCPMPHNDLGRGRRNAELEHMKRIKIDDAQKEFTIADITQTDSDVEFIDRFYDILKKVLVEVVELGGIVDCSSFAVFNNGGQYRHINNYIMFSEVRNLFNGDFIKIEGTNQIILKIILSEWVFEKYNYKMNIHKHKNKVIDYTDSEQIIYFVNEDGSMRIEI